MKKLQLIALSSLISTTVANASVTLAFEFQSLRDAAGAALSDGSTAAIFVNTSGNDFASLGTSLSGATLSAGNTYGGDLLLALGSTGTNDGSKGFLSFDNTQYDSLDGISAGTEFAVVWFDTTSTTINNGVSYGLFQSTSAAESDLNAALVKPSEGATVSIVYYNTEFEGKVSVADFTADMTVVPEPSSTALLGLGSVALLLRRRR